MRGLTSICLLVFLTNYAFGQDTTVRKTDSTKQTQSFMIRDPAEITNDECIFIVDDMTAIKSTSKHILKEINPNDILVIQVLKESALDRTSSVGFHGQAIVITTKKYAISQFQKRLSAFSKEYKLYLQNHQNDDKDVLYIVNGVPLDAKDKNEITLKLYNISYNNLKRVTYSDNFIEGMKSGVTLFITTKQ